MLEHPRVSEYLEGAHVRIPSANDPNDYCIARIVSLDIPKDGATFSTKLHVAVESESKSRTVSLNSVSNEAFSQSELDRYIDTLMDKVQSRAPFIENLPKELTVRSNILKSFTFSEEEVRAILEARKQQGSKSVQKVIDHKHLHERRSELEVIIQKCRDKLKDSLPSARHAESKRLMEAQAELTEIQNTLSTTTATPTSAVRTSFVTHRRNTVIGASSKLSARRDTRASIMWAGRAKETKNDTASSRPPIQSNELPSTLPTGENVWECPREKQVNVLENMIRSSGNANLRGKIGHLIGL
eukprot:GHVO01064619.1.p1 GENE.GHVO01064619.1~~GHVO01064619.1.p1  ORF type:complete len:342 (+),score=51.31 GHVO01064619.1:130-1026(+)